MSKISVVIATRDRGEIINEAIQSVLDQTMKDFELIIVDDHSSSNDKTEEVVERFNDERIKYHKLSDQNGKGISCARNFGNMLATSDIIAVLDSDDISYPDRLELTLKAFAEKKCSIVYGEIDYWWPETGEVKKRDNDCYSRSFNLEDYKKVNFIPHVTSAYKRELAINLPYNSFFRKAEDYDFFSRAALLGYKFYFIDRSLTKYRKHDGSISKSTSDNFDYPDIVRRNRGW